MLAWKEYIYLRALSSLAPSYFILTILFAKIENHPYLPSSLPFWIGGWELLFWLFQHLLSCCSVTLLCPTPRPHGLQHARLPCPLLPSGVCSNTCPLSQGCYPTISAFTQENSACQPLTNFVLTNLSVPKKKSSFATLQSSVPLLMTVVFLNKSFVFLTYWDSARLLPEFIWLNINAMPSMDYPWHFLQ